MPEEDKDYIADVIEHLSRDIISISDSMMTFRTRIAFFIWTGPFIVLGSYVIATGATVPSLFSTPPKWLSAYLAGAAYLLLHVVGAKIERQGQNTCNKLRKAIMVIADERSLKSLREGDYTNDTTRHLSAAYIAVGLLMLTCFLSLMYCVSA